MFLRNLPFTEIVFENILHHHLAVNGLSIPEGFAGPLVSQVASPAFF